MFNKYPGNLVIKMRLIHIKHLLRLYNTFFLRKILNFGILKNPIIRVLLLAIFIVLITLITFFVFTFFSTTLQTKNTVLFLLNTYTLSIILWTFVVTFFLKVVFSKVDGFLKMTINFPISNKERNFSVFIYETFICFMTIFIISFSVVLSIVLIHKLSFIDTLIVNLIYVSTITYLVLQVISKITSYICSFFKIPKLFHIINLSILVFIFAMSFRESQGLITKLSNDFIQNTNQTKSFLLLFQQVHHQHGFLLTTFMYSVLVLFLIGIIIIIPDRSYMESTKHILIAKSNWTSLIKAYVLSSLRNMNTLNTVALVYLVAIILILFHHSNFILYTMIILALNSIYSFINSQNLRQILYRFHYAAWKDYLYLVASQLFIVYIVSLPIYFLGLFIIDSSINILYPYLIVTLGVLMFSLAGILFPPYNDNPFSVITSIVVVTAPVLIIGVAFTFLNLSTFLNVLLIIFFFIVIILFSVQGLINLQRSFRHENDVYSR